MSERFDAWGFDGRTAAAHPASVRLDGTTLVIESQGREQRMSLADARISEPFEAAPRLVCTAAGETFEVADAQRFTRALEQSGYPVSPVVRLQRHAPAATGALAVLLASFVAAYLYGVPAAARWAARQTPRAAQERLGEQVLAVLEETFLAPSALPEAERTTITARFAGAAERIAPGEPVRLEFRSVQSDEREDAHSEPANAEEPAESEPQSADPEAESGEREHGMINALSLPGGIIVVLDGLVEAATPEQVFAVLGHELGHVVLDHSMQSVYRSAGVAALAGLAWGDFSGVAASVPTALGMLRYDRQLEAEADDYAVSFLGMEGLSAETLCAFFRSILAVEAGPPADFPEFLSTHPDTNKRIARICPSGSGG
jgi:Zn-dependent protease with chaperone function